MNYRGKLICIVTSLIYLSMFFSRMLYRLIIGNGRRLIQPARRTSSAIEQKKETDMLETINIEDLPRAQKRFAKQFEKV